MFASVFASCFKSFDWAMVSHHHRFLQGAKHELMAPFSPLALSMFAAKSELIKF
jgi:hypothetical protein